MMALVARHAGDRDSFLRQEVVDLRLECLECIGGAHRDAPQMVSTSPGESFAPGRKRRYADMGILPALASSHDATSSARCCSVEYAVHSEKLTAERPLSAPRAMTKEKGATFVYQREDIVLEWHSPQARST